MTKNRFPDEVIEDAQLAGIRSRVLGAVAQERTPRFSRARKGAIAAITAGGLAVALTGGAIAVVQATHEEVSYSVQCYDAASVNAHFTTVGTPIATDIVTGEESRDATDPVATCGEMWRMGLIGQDAAPDDPSAADFTVPELVGCTLENGIGAGFPRGDSAATSEEFCQNLGLAIWVG